MLTADFEIDRMLVMSTGHITLETSLALDGVGGHCMPATIPWTSYGWLIWVDEAWIGTTETHLELATLLKIARASGCKWLRLDCDGPEMDGIPTFDWEAAARNVPVPCRCCVAGLPDSFEVNIFGTCKACSGSRVHPVGDDPDNDFSGPPCPKCGAATHQCASGDPGCMHCHACAWMRLL